jgi:hypothetical protein
VLAGSTPERRLLGLLLVWGLAACKAAPSVPRLTCEHESVDGLSLSLSRSQGSDFEGGDYELSLDADGIRSVCRFKVTHARGPDCSGERHGTGNCFEELANQVCGGLNLVIGRGLICDVPNRVGSATGRCQALEPVTEHIEWLGTPTRVSLQQRAPNGQSSELSFEPPYTTLEPHGAGRAPRCRIARENRQWPSSG